MILSKKVIEICKEAEDNFYWDVEANSHFYFISWQNGQLLIDEVDSYTYYDECGDITHTDNSYRLEEIKCTLKDYTETIIALFNEQLNYAKYEDSYYGDIIRYIRINKIIKSD